MKHTFQRKRVYFVVAGAVIAVVIGFGLWLKAAHDPVVPRQLAQQFVRHLRAGEFASAHELTLKNGHVGKTPAEMEAIAKRELCRATRFAGTFPFQSNGNRLRRWINGTDVDMPEVNVEFDGAGLFGVRMRRNAAGEWKVFRFACHAG